MSAVEGAVFRGDRWVRTKGEQLAAEAILFTGDPSLSLSAAQVEEVVASLSRAGLLRDVPLPERGQLQWEREIELREATDRYAADVARWAVDMEGYARHDRASKRFGFGGASRTYIQLDAGFAAWLGKAAVRYLRGEA